MKRIYIILFSMFLAFDIQAKEIIKSAQSQAENYYTICATQASNVQTDAVIQGNIEDIMRERKIRECLKAKIIEVASSYISDKELIKYQASIDSLEKSLFGIYKTLIFCQDKSNNFWCEERFKDDMSLEKLSLEKKLTSYMLEILKQTIESKQGN
ncbi:MAG: hypothetical protein IJ529_02985 [Alphaproteobacteria bacterium]|nr:hypothetical protein [Alphaproteobacteria bacterium]MBQ9245354.1 hypothetical protein [bacterium]